MSKILTKQKKVVIWKSKNFIVETRLYPHISKDEGGHIVISPIIKVREVFDLDLPLQIELIKIISASSKALKKVLVSQGIIVEYTNNQDNGNWSHLFGKDKSLHIHIYGRVKNSSIQKFGQALYFPDPHSDFYDNNIPLSQDDCNLISKFIDLYL